MSILGISKTYKTARRLQQIINVFLRHGFGQIIDQIQLGRYIPFKKRLRSFGRWAPLALRGPTIPERLRVAFGELGPSFIKFAQLLSSRPDLVTPRYANEFKKLRDEVPPFSTKEVESIIEEELKLPADKAFKQFDKAPLAAASIAQSHMATLIDGSDVVVKVQRPGIKEQIESDISILSGIARLLDKYVPESRFFNPMSIVDEFSKTVRKELDFTREAKNCYRFKNNFEYNPDIYIPKVYTEFTTERVLVMETIKGVRVDDIKAIDAFGLDRKRIGRTIVDAYFKQILTDGFFHADPHPGNILVMSTGAVAFLDFGIVGRVSDKLKETMADTFMALIEKDFDRLADLYVDLGIISDKAGPDTVREDLKEDLQDLLEPLYGLPLQEVKLAQYLDAITQLAIKHNLTMPPDLLLVNKSLLILESFGRQLDPDFDIVAASGPYAAMIIESRISPPRLYEKAKKNIMEISDFAFLLPKQLKQIIKKTLKDDLQMKMYHVNLPDFIKDMDKASNRIAFAMVVSAIIMGSAVLYAAGVGPTAFGISIPGVFGFAFAFLLGIWLIISIIRSGRL
ncbi:AarF/ABC1/UbiB kinase family protein [Thermodesulfovibrionales bacterium]|nr:AarF/ABC1/UbiB kinase family protein [Thermodesulfovibrionales bacterium]MCL0061410.1 AarF/ABC1/UbiB kinase family protein [Thermodesulfovibrionales bacterium]